MVGQSYFHEAKLEVKVKVLNVKMIRREEGSIQQLLN